MISSRAFHAAVLIAGVSMIAGCPKSRPSGARALGGLLLSVEPKEAEVYVDDRYLGVIAALRSRPLMLPLGLRRLEVRAEGYFAHYAEVRIVRGVQQRLQIKLRKRPF